MKKSAHSLAILGACLQIALPVGIAVQPFRVPFHHLDVSKVKSLDETMILFNQMQQITFDAVWGGPGIALIGLLLFIYTITALHYRRPWAFWFACVYGSLLTLALPFGTPFGVFLLVNALTHKKEFLREQLGDQQVVV